MTFVDVLVTFPDRASAVTVARACVEARLAACASIGPGVVSIYRWRGAVETAEEVTLTIKTRARLFDDLCNKVKAMHPYETPCIIASEIAAIEPGFAAWLQSETD